MWKERKKKKAPAVPTDVGKKWVSACTGNNKKDEFKTVFASIGQIRQSNLQRLEPYVANYRMRLQKSGKVLEYVQVSEMTTLLGVFPDNRRAAGVTRNMEEYGFENRRSETKTQVLLPMARAFTI